MAPDSARRPLMRGRRGLHRATRRRLLRPRERLATQLELLPQRPVLLQVAAGHACELGPVRFCRCRVLAARAVVVSLAETRGPLSTGTAKMWKSCLVSRGMTDVSPRGAGTSTRA